MTSSSPMRPLRGALAAGTTAQLIVDAARFVSLGAKNMQPADRDYFLVLLRDDRLRLLELLFKLLRRRLVRIDLHPLEIFIRQSFRVTAEQDIRTAASHVRRDGDRALTARLCDDLGFAFVVFRV